MHYRANSERYESMTYRRCGRSGILLPAISLGLWHNFGDGDVYSVGRETVLCAFDHGITHFDLANNYGPPIESAEKTFGRIYREDLREHRQELLISTKAGYRNRPGPYGEFCSRKSLIGSLDQSLENLGLDYVDIFYSHRFDPETPLEETMTALDFAVRSGRALYAGVSNYPEEKLDEAISMLKDLGTPCLIDQVSYNMLNREIEKERLDVLRRQKVGCIVFCPLAQGQLTERYLKGIPKGSRATKSQFLNESKVHENLPIVEGLNQIAQERGQSLAAMALAWVLRSSEVTSALIGASSPEQLKANLKALDDLDFSSEELARIETLLESSS